MLHYPLYAAAAFILDSELTLERVLGTCQYNQSGNLNYSGKVRKLLVCACSAVPVPRTTADEEASDVDFKVNWPLPLIMDHEEKNGQC